MKWCGIIGFSETVETKPDVWETQITERKYFGDVVEYRRRMQSSDKLNDDITIDSTISIISDHYCNQNLKSIRYIEFMGTKWKVETVQVRYPRLELTLGGVYNA